MEIQNKLDSFVFRLWIIYYVCDSLNMNVNVNVNMPTEFIKYNENSCLQNCPEEQTVNIKYALKT
jgi:hypothetical protein